MVGATCVVATYVKKLSDSQQTAGELYDRVLDLQNLLNSIKPVIEDVERSSRQAVANDQTQQLKKTVRGCLEGCNRSIKNIQSRLSGFADGRRGSLKARITFVFGEREITAHKATVEGHIQSLQLALIALNGLNDTVNHAITHQSLQTVMQFLAYFLVMQRQYQSHSTTMGLRTQDATSTSLPLTDSTSAMRMLTSIEEPEQNLSLYFNTIAWNRDEPLPASSNRSLPEPISSDRMEELPSVDEQVEQDDTFMIEAVLDTPLAMAVKKNQPAILQALIAGGQGITVVDAEGWTLLHHAVFERAHDALSVLLQCAQDQSLNLINAQNKKQHTAVMLCTRKAEYASSRELAMALIEHGADLNIEDGHGRTALYFVVECPANDNREALAKLLVENGAAFGSQCRRLPRCADDYEAVQNLANQLRRTGSTASAMSPIDHLETSPDSPTSSTTGEGRRKSWKLSINSIKRRFSSDPDTGGAA